jgi:CDP-diglyceride synthetase
MLSLLGVVALGLPFGYTILVRTLPPGRGLQLLGGLCVWNADTGALVVGKLLGGPKALPVSLSRV